MGIFQSTFKASDIPALTGKVAIVTGSSSGIGVQTALQLALHGAKVYMATRSEEKTSALIQRLEGEHSELKGRLVWLKTDLSSVKSCQDAAKEFESKEERLDLIVNNGAEAMTPFALTDEGVSRTFAVCHLGHFALTTALLPLLERTAKLPDADVRVVNVASLVHTSAPATTDFVTLEDFKATCATGPKVDGLFPYAARYGHSKLANILFTKELQKRLDADGVPIITLAVHPGSVATEGSKKFMGFLFPIAEWFFLTPLQGALTSLFCATSPKVLAEKNKYKAAYVVPYGQIGKESDKAKDVEMAGRLWALSEQAVKEIDAKGHI
ncbi:NAD(P)-binding protein [Calocera cornea HHB12733]|uniref:NAD(P)-binding protein n=1 Tax=Calocera cornea HHB12733 TaxID=1353952 RepID=A0A165EUK1_9BASI|nr:NAD(P)-binding protein [Calocera cornea HHB12733]